MPEKLEKELTNQAKKLGLKGDRKNAYIYGTMRKTGWKPKREIEETLSRTLLKSINMFEDAPYKVTAIQQAAFFISPFGNVIDVSGSKHITNVCQNPEKYGLTRAKIEKVYNDYNETYGIEGKAREEILIDLISKGWIRIRRYYSKTMGYRWSVNVSEINERTMGYISKFFSDYTDEKDFEDDVYISDGIDTLVQHVGEINSVKF